MVTHPPGPRVQLVPTAGQGCGGGWLRGSRAAGRVGRFCSEQPAQPCAGGGCWSRPSSPWCLAWPLLSSLLPCPRPAPSLPAGAPAHGQLVSVVRLSCSGSCCLKEEPGGRESSGPQRRVVQGGQSRDWSPGVRLPAQGSQRPLLAPGVQGEWGGVLPAHSNAFPAWPLGLRLLGALTPRLAGMADGHLPVRSHLSSACPGPDVSTFIANYRLGLVLSGWGGEGQEEGGVALGASLYPGSLLSPECRARPTAGHFAQVGVLCTKRGAHRERLSEGPLALSLHCPGCLEVPRPQAQGQCCRD